MEALTSGATLRFGERDEVQAAQIQHDYVVTPTVTRPTVSVGSSSSSNGARSDVRPLSPTFGPSVLRALAR
jgi:hypothetical protein